MEIIREAINWILHIDEKLPVLIDDFGIWVYVIFFGIVFLETGIVIFPFLPGDSLLFATGAIASTGSLNIWTLYFVFLAGAIIGDTLNYWIGHYIGPKAFESNSRFLKKKHLVKAQKFYEEHGAKSIVLARFIPIIRTFAPFVAGIGSMNYTKFITYNVLGAFLWVTSFLWVGYFFGNVSFIKNNFHFAVVGIIIVSTLPIVYEFVQARREKVSD